MQYSFNNLKGDNFVFALRYDVNASYKDLGAVCDAIKYKKAQLAMDLLDKVIAKSMPIAFRRHSKHMGARHELGGIKGGYPVKAATEVKKTLINAVANANNKGFSGSDLFVVGASANKTHIERRYPSKGSIAWGRGMYGRSAMNHSDLEFAKIEIVLSDDYSPTLTHNMKYFIKKNTAIAKALANEKKTSAKKTEKKSEAPKPKAVQAAPVGHEAQQKPQQKSSEVKHIDHQPEAPKQAHEQQSAPKPQTT